MAWAAIVAAVVGVEVYICREETRCKPLAALVLLT